MLTRNFILGGLKMSEKNRQFKKNKQSGEHRNGRKIQYKNYNVEAGEEPNEFFSRKKK